MYNLIILIRRKIEMKKVLILTVTAGNGHNACARAMKNRLEQSGDVEVRIVDILKSYSTPLNVWVADGGYCLAVSKLPRIYNAFYKMYRAADPLKRYSCAPQKTVLSTVEGLLKEILGFQPDVIYGTHFYSSIAITNLKLLYDLPCKSVVTVLDYIDSPFWEAGIGIDNLVIPNEDFIETFTANGFKREQLLPLGMPVDGRSLHPTEKSEAREKLGLKQDVFTILVTFGGGHWSGEYKIIKNAVKTLKDKNVQIIAINGRNKDSYKKINRLKKHSGVNILNVGFTNDVPLHLSAADLAIGKCGGPSTTEILNAGIPMFVSEYLPAQEQFNLAYIKKKGAALSYKNKKDFKDKLLFLLDNPEVLQGLKAASKALRNNAIDELAKFISKQPEADYTQLLNENIDVKQVKKRVKHALKKADKAERKKR